MPDKRWNITEGGDPDAVHLATALGVRKLYADLLVCRGITNYEQARRFFRPATGHLHDPFSMLGMTGAVERICAAVSRGERILVYGDYDADGVTATAAVFSFLRDRNALLGFYIPDRQREGYGISAAGIRYAAAEGFSVLIALDCGIRDHQTVSLARSAGIDVILCDHHLPAERLPPAYAILNPKQRGCPYPYKELSGCGIGLKLIAALSLWWNLPEEEAFRYLDLVAISIAADVVPLTGENRILAFHGLKKLNAEPLPGIAALAYMANRQGRPSLSLEDVAFRMAPAVNAAGRMGDAGMAVRLFLARDKAEASPLAAELHRCNADRRQLDKSITEEALSIIGSGGPGGRRTTVLHRPHWHKGVLGIVASRVMETYYRPTVILTGSGAEITGSARSMPGFNILNAIKECAPLLESYGGHAQAAGVRLAPDKLEAFSEAFEQAVCRAPLPPATTQLDIDAEIRLEDALRIYPLLRQFEPFGPGNRRPVFVSRRLTDTGHSRVLKDGHLRLEARQPGGQPVAGIGFRLGDKFPVMAAPFDACYHIGENTWKGKTSLQLVVLDVQPALNDAGAVRKP
jgi:single-stranded-DNA-specific exonuclease